MLDTNQANPACDLRGIREAVCVHTDKITDSCMAKDCIEDLRVYLTQDSQAIADRSTSARARFVELLHVDISVETVPYNNGYYSVDVTFYYRIIGEAAACGGRPNTITGLGVFSKRLILFGGDTSAKTFSSKSFCGGKGELENCSTPTAVIELVDPIILGSSLREVCNCCCCPETPAIPESILGCYDEELVMQGECKRFFVSIGQFSITRMQRCTQLLIPAFDYCIPSKECPQVGGVSTETPCEVFSQMDFPVDAFFPSKNETCIPASQSCSCCRKTSES